MPMNTVAARTVAAHVAELIEFASIFQARYGKQYRMKPGSPAEAWNIYNAILDKQVTIASLLDYPALENPLQRCPQWWKYQDCIDIGTASMMATEVSHLIAACAWFEAEPIGEPSPVILSAQQVIAGMLQPNTIMLAQEGQTSLRLAS
jgi:hypothetical protein